MHKHSIWAERCLVDVWLVLAANPTWLVVDCFKLNSINVHPYILFTLHWFHLKARIVELLEHEFNFDWLISLMSFKFHLNPWDAFLRSNFFIFLIIGTLWKLVLSLKWLRLLSILHDKSHLISIIILCKMCWWNLTEAFWIEISCLT